MTNPLRSPDPSGMYADVDPTRLPTRLESRATTPDTFSARGDAVRAYRSGALSVATAATITWDALTHDTIGIWNSGTSFIIPSTGKITGFWEIQCQIVWPGTGAGVNRQIEIRRNGTVMTTKAGPATTTYQDIYDTIYDPSRNDIFTITVVHDAGGSLALTVGSDKTYFNLIHTG